MAARRPYRMTPARKAAIRKAQIASARKRKGSGKGKPVSMRRRAAQASGGGVKRRATAPKAAAKTSNRKRNLRRIAVASAAVAAAGGAAHVFKNREKYIVRHVAVTKAVHQEMRSAKSMGQKLTKYDIELIKHFERQRHANRSAFRVREYKAARNIARLQGSRGLSLRPDRANNAWKSNGINVTQTPRAHERYMFEAYRKDVYSRALARHAKITGKKSRFNSNSGKRLLVNQKGKVRRAFWA